MRLKLLRLLAVAITLALPIQGVAAITAGLCMAFGEHQGPVTGQDHSHQSKVPSVEDHSVHSHTHGDEADNQVQGNEGTGSGSHCGPCTACCASASIAGPAGIWIASSASNAQYIFSQFPPPGVQPDGVDRPPLAL